MLTFQKEGGTPIAILVDGKSETPIYWFPFKEAARKIQVANIQEYNSEEFRDRFNLSAGQAEEIMKHIVAKTTPEGPLQNKFFQVKKFISDSLFSEIDLRDSPGQVLKYPIPDKDFIGHEAIVGSTNSGKTFHILQKCLANITGPKRKRREWIWISAEWAKDVTIKPLREKLRFQKYVTGIDVSEQAFQNSEHSSRDAFFEHEVKAAVDYAAPRTCVVCDDFQDSCCAPQMRGWINQALRVSRHRKVSFIIIFHNIRAGSFSAQAHNSVARFTVFPRSQRGKIIMYINKDHGIPLQRCRDIVDDFASQRKGRAMTINLHAPNFFGGADLLTLF